MDIIKAIDDLRNDIKAIAKKNEDNLSSSGINDFLNWLTEHKIYSIILIILIGRAFKHYRREK